MSISHDGDPRGKFDAARLTEGAPVGELFTALADRFRQYGLTAKKCEQQLDSQIKQLHGEAGEIWNGAVVKKGKVVYSALDVRDLTATFKLSLPNKMGAGKTLVCGLEIVAPTATAPEAKSLAVVMPEAGVFKDLMHNLKTQYAASYNVDPASLEDRFKGQVGKTLGLNSKETRAKVLSSLQYNNLRLLSNREMRFNAQMSRSTTVGGKRLAYDRLVDLALVERVDYSHLQGMKPDEAVKLLQSGTGVKRMQPEWRVETK